MESTVNTPSATSGRALSAAATINQRSTTLESSAELVGRILLASLFLLSGVSKLGAYGATAAYMSSAGVPGALLPAVIAVELLGSLAVIVGWKTRAAAALLAGFSLLAAFLFHNNFADQIQMIMFLKNVAIAGGFLLLVANGAGAISLDRRATAA
jgi:putative oxidoreductase